jgi:DNA-nicking Smr family endonuclease
LVLLKTVLAYTAGRPGQLLQGLQSCAGEVLGDTPAWSGVIGIRFQCHLRLVFALAERALLHEAVTVGSHSFIILRTMNDDEDFLFQDAMADVTPLQHEQRIALKKDIANADAQQARRSSATAVKAEVNPLADENILPLDSWYVLSFKRPGVQNGVFRKLKQGRYEAEARLNLHRMGFERARREIYAFVQQAEELGLRSVQIVHGKGENSSTAEQASIIKGGVDHWLRELETVQAFHSSKPQHGGTGAVYVLLRKNEEQKQKNRERFLGR